VPPVLSATRLETFARCPRRYFFESVLGVVPRPVSVRLLGPDVREYGSLVHRILERYVRAQIGRRPGEGADDPFAVASVLAIAEEELKAFEADGLAGPGPAWRVEQVRLRRELRTFALADRAWRQREGVVTVGVEEPFGQAGSVPVSVDVPGRQPVHFRGTIDRVDETAAGQRIVTDYKTGSPHRYRKIEKDHFQEGSAVQLPVYALAVGVTDEGPVRSDYWCVSERGEFRRFGFEVTSKEVEVLRTVVDVLSETLESGHFPANPGGPRTYRHGQCDFCPFDRVCPADRQRSWDRVKRDASLSRLAALMEPT
jgi:RecB family exonuclease